MSEIKLFKLSEISKQIDTKENSLFSSREGVIEPNIDFELLLQTYESSSVISGIVKKIASAGNVGFQKTDNKILDDFLSSLDIISIFSDMLVFGNSFLERLSNMKKEKTLDLEKIITTTIRIASKGNKDEADYYQRSKKGLTKVPFNKDEVLFFKNISISDSYYGDSLFYTCTDEIILLAFITKYYKNFFKGGNIEPNILYDETGNLTVEQVEKIEEMIKDKISGIDNSHNTLFISGKIGKVDLTTRIDPDKFIALKRELKEDIAIATNIPFSLLSPENSNKAISQTDINTLYSDIVIPLQNRFLSQLKRQLKDWSLESVSDDEINSISFHPISLKDGLEEMKILTGYQKTGNLSINEVRAKAGLGDNIDSDIGDIYEKDSSSKNEDNEDVELSKIKEEVKKMYQK